MKSTRATVSAEIATAIALEAFSLMNPAKYTRIDPASGAKISNERIMISTQMRKKSTTTMRANNPRAKIVT